MSIGYQIDVKIFGLTFILDLILFLIKLKIRHCNLSSLFGLQQKLYDRTLLPVAGYDPVHNMFQVHMAYQVSAK